jgi:hypothetical protein
MDRDPDKELRSDLLRHFRGKQLVRKFPDIGGYGNHEYSNRVGIFRILAVLDKYGIKPTLALDKAVADHYPFLIKEGQKRDAEFIMAAWGRAVDRKRASQDTPHDMTVGSDRTATGQSVVRQCRLSHAGIPAVCAGHLRLVQRLPAESRPFQVRGFARRIEN